MNDDRFEFAFIRDALEYILVQLHKLEAHPLEDAIIFFEDRGNGTTNSLGVDVGKPYLDFARGLKDVLTRLSKVDSGSPIQ